MKLVSRSQPSAAWIRVNRSFRSLNRKITRSGPLISRNRQERMPMVFIQLILPYGKRTSRKMQNNPCNLGYKSVNQKTSFRGCREKKAERSAHHPLQLYLHKIKLQVFHHTNQNQVKHQSCSPETPLIHRTLR